MPVLSDDELVTELVADTGEYRMELQVDQVSPLFRVPGRALLPIRDGGGAAVAAALDGMSDRMRGVLAVCDVAQLARGDGWYAGLPPAGEFVVVGHDSDRSYAGYGNLVRALAALAPLLGDARFFVSEDYDVFVDDYQIQDGVLRVTRGHAADEFRTAKRAYYLARARDERDAASRDALRRFVAWTLAHAASHGIPPRAGAAPNNKEFQSASRDLAIAAELDPDAPDVRFQHGRRARAVGDHAAAAAHFRRAEATNDAKLACHRATIAATAIAAGDHELARAVIERAAGDQTAWILRGHLAGKDGLIAAARAALTAIAIGDREAIPWTGAGGAILDEHAQAVAALVTAGEFDAAIAARHLLGWAELYRIRTAHELERDASRAIADRLFAQAGRLDPLGGAVATQHALHRHGVRGRGAAAELAAVLVEFPDHAEALYWVASDLDRRGDWAKAVELWRRYDSVSAARSSYERGAARACLINSLTQAAYQRMQRGDHGAQTEQLLDEAIARSEHGGWIGPFVGKADLLEHRREHTAALRAYDRAIERDPQSAHAWSGRGSCLNNLGRSADALACFDKALALDAGYWHVHYGRACTLAKLGGDRDEIRALVQRALALAPERRTQILDEPDLAAHRTDLADL